MSLFDLGSLSGAVARFKWRLGACGLLVNVETRRSHLTLLSYLRSSIRDCTRVQREWMSLYRATAHSSRFVESLISTIV